MTNEQLIDQAGHRLGALINQPGYAHEIEKLIQLAKNEAYREAIQACSNVLANDGKTGQHFQWYVGIDFCSAAITALIKEI